MTQAIEILEAVFADHAEELCTYGNQCERVAIYRALFQVGCNHPHFACIPHRAEVDSTISAFPMTGWVCKQCNALLGLFQGWEPV